MTRAVVLDAAAFDVVDTPAGNELRRLLRSSLVQGAVVCTAAVTLAEVCRGASRTRRVEVALARDRGGRPVEVVPTDERLAKLVGALLLAADRGSAGLADAHVVAICAPFEVALVVTAEPDDIAAIGSGLPGTRIVTQRPDRIRTA